MAADEPKSPEQPATSPAPEALPPNSAAVAQMPPAAPAAKAPADMVLPIFAAAIFLSAALLFAVQPLFTKMVLPRLGGSPSVWSVAMVFFQAMLLGGYAYAHFLTRHLPGRMSVIVHLAVMLVATLALPLAIASGWGRPPSQGESFWLLGLFTVSIGLPFFALSANGPLLQAWFARTDHPAAKDPYFLYAASNIGSFLALIAYPFVIEPMSRLGQQTKFWSIGFYALIALIAVCGVLLLRSRNALVATEAEGTTEEAPPTWKQAATWVALAAIPSALLIAVTAHVSTDVAAAPLLWVIPLALYLLTFVIVFQSKPLIPHDWMVKAQPVVIALLVGVLAFEVLDYIFVTMALNLLAFFVTAMVCHGELAKRRPAPRHLTSFYMWMSTGGMIGGIAAGLIAPQVFNWVAEYPLLIVLAMLCRPGLELPSGRNEMLLWIGALAIAAVVIIARVVYRYELEADAFKAVIGGLLVFSLLFWRDPLKLAAVIALAFMVVRLYDSDGLRRDSVRSFFGVIKITESWDGQYRIMMHGTTEHGAQHVRDAEGKPITDRPVPLTYYHADSPMAEAIKAVRERKKGPIKMAVVGLGTGSLTCYFQPGDTLHIYEIDPAVVRISTDPKRFSYYSSCAPDAKIILGDARLTLADGEDGQYDIILVDAFSSDAIPVHLMTQEAMAIYLKKLAPEGMVVMHVSNRHMELASVVAGIANANGMVARTNESDKGENDELYKFSSTVVAAVRKDEDFGALATAEGWEVEEADEDQRVWTDDYSNVVGAMIRQLKK